MTETIAPTSVEHSDCEANQAIYDRLQAQLLVRNRAASFDALAAAGITHVSIHFDGYGDDGQIQNIEVKNGDTIVSMPDSQIEIACAGT